MKRTLALLLVTAIAIFFWVLIESPLRAADGSSGISLFYAQVSFPAALGLLLAGGLVPFVLCVAIGCWGNPLRGVFAMCLSLTVLGHRGGGMANWLRTHDLPGAYAVLMVELVVWALLLGALVAAIHLARTHLARRLPMLPWGHSRYQPLWRADWDTLGGGLTTAGIGAVMVWFILQTPDVGQVTWGLGLSFLIAGFAGHYIWPAAAPVGLVAAPLVVGLGGYGAAIIFYRGSEQVLAAFYAGQFHGHAMALPIHYVSAALVGTLLGVAWRQVLAESEKTAGNASSPQEAGSRTPAPSGPDAGQSPSSPGNSPPPRTSQAPPQA